MIIQFIVALLATVSFAILYDAPYKELLFAGLCGAVGWVVCLFLTEKMQMNQILACVIATFILTVMGRILAVIRRCPTTVYLLVSIFPLVPGSGIYYTSYYLITRQRRMFATMGLSTFETATAIAFGIALGFGLPQNWFYLFAGGKRKKMKQLCQSNEENEETQNKNMKKF